jgi:hypothetical protein
VRLSSDSYSVFWVGLPSIQEIYLGILIISWLGYFRFENSFLLNRSRVSYF